MDDRTTTLKVEQPNSRDVGSASKNARDIDAQNSKMHFGFRDAMDHYFYGSRNPKEFAQEMQNAGFCYDWPLRTRETAVARLAVKSKLRALGEPQDKLSSLSQSLLDVFVAVYQSGCDQQGISQ